MAKSCLRKTFRSPKISDRFRKASPCKAIAPRVIVARRMARRFFGRRWRFSFAAFFCVLAVVRVSLFFQGSHAQANKLILISQETSTRAIALDSVTLKREPFNSTSEVTWGNDHQTRVMLFAMGLDPKFSASSLTANAEDGSHKIYPLTVEYVGPVPEQD